MKKLIILVLVALMIIALMAPAFAGADPHNAVGKGKGCGCHRVADLMPGSVHTGYVASGGANGGAAVCMKCH